MIRKFTFLLIVASVFFINTAKAQPGVPPQYPYTQAFDSLQPFQFIEDQAGWLNGNFIALDPSTVGVYPNRGIGGSQSMTMLLSDNMPTDSIITPLIGSLNAGAFVSFYYRIVDFNNQAVTLSGNGGFKLQMKDANALEWILIDSISTTNHIVDSNYKKIIHSLPIDSINVNFRFAFYQGTPGQDFYIDIDSLVISDTLTVVTGLQTSTPNNFIVQNNEFNQINVNYNDPNSTNTTINIFDLNGRIVHRSRLNSNNKVIDASNWNKGVYFVQISDGKNQINKKIIVR
jgi:hypothetical protein